MLDVQWPDATVRSVTLDDETIVIEVADFTGPVFVTGTGVIGVQLIGLWDDVIVERADVTIDHPFAARCLQRVDDRWDGAAPETRSPGRNARRFETLAVTLIDGAELLRAAASFSARRPPGTIDQE